MTREAYSFIDEQNGPVLPLDYLDPFETALEGFLSNISNTQLQVIGPELIFGTLYNRIEAHICICFTAYTIILELERMLKNAQSQITVYQAGHLTKTMYRLEYHIPKSKRKMSVLLKMDELQRELYEIVCGG